MQHLLNRILEFNEWGQCTVLQLVSITPSDERAGVPLNLTFLFNATSPILDDAILQIQLPPPYAKDDAYWPEGACLTKPLLPQGWCP